MERRMGRLLRTLHVSSEDQFSQEDSDYICMNEQSRNYGCWTRYSDECEDFEGRISIQKNY